MEIREGTTVTKLDPCSSVARGAGLRVHPCLMACLALLTLSACVSPAPPPDAFYRIAPVAAVRHFATPPLPGVLEVQGLTADGVLDERAITVAATAGGPLSHYQYDLWSDPPGRMLQDRLAHVLAAAGVADRVLTPELGVPPDWTLRGKVRRFEHLSGSSQVAVELELSVVSAHDGSLVLLEDYSALVPTGAGGVEAAVSAMDQGVAQVFGRFLADLGRARGDGGAK